MADVKWIKFYVSILTDPKIKRIRRMPDGNTIALIWAYLLAQAGKSNKDGAVYFTDEIAYSEEDFAEDYNFNLKTVQFAMVAFEKYGMIEIYDGIIYVKNWEKYQNTDGLEKMKEQNRIRQSNYRNKQKLLQNNVISNVTDNAEVTQSNAIDIDIEIDKDIDKEKEESIPDDKPSSRTPKHKYGEYQHVLLKDQELEKLKLEYGELETEEAIKFLDEYIEMKGYKSKNHNLVLRRWVYDAVKERKQKKNYGKKSTNDFYDDMKGWVERNDSERVCDN